MGKIAGKWGRDFFIDMGKFLDRKGNQKVKPWILWVKVWPWIRIAVISTRNRNSP